MDIVWIAAIAAAWAAAAAMAAGLDRLAPAGPQQAAPPAGARP